MVFIKGNKPWNKGMKGGYSEDYRAKLSESHKGLKKSNEVKLKISKLLKKAHADGRHNGGFKNGNKTWNKGLTKENDERVKEYGRKISLIKKGNFKGENNPNWRGGKSSEEYTKKFNKELKEMIRNKYGRKCLECGYSESELGYKLPIHHIDYDKKNNDENNLIPLCRLCHAQTNFNREDWINYYKKIEVDL
jgi:hypothetical protein